MSDDARGAGSDTADGRQEAATPGARWMAAGSVLVLVALGLALCLPTERLTAVWGTGHLGSNGASYANACRSYHRASLTMASWCPAWFRALDGSVRPDRVYVSQFPTHYLIYAAVTAVTGVSEAAIRSIGVGFTLLNGILLLLLLRRWGGFVMLVGSLLFATTGLVVEFGVIAVNMVPVGGALMLALWGLMRLVDGRSGVGVAVLCATPVSMLCTHTPAFFLVGACVGLWLTNACPRRALARVALMAIPYVVMMALHAWGVSLACGGLDPLIQRVTTRSSGGGMLHRLNLYGEIARHFCERMGPLLLAAILAAVIIIRRRKELPGRFAVVVALGLTILLQTLALPGVAGIHRFALLSYVPAAAWLAAPPMADWLRRPGAGRWAVVVLLLASLAMGMHRWRKWSPPDEHERALAAAASLAGEHVGPDGRVLLLMGGGLTGTRLSAQYYTGVDMDVVSHVVMQPVKGKPGAFWLPNFIPDMTDYNAVLVVQAEDILDKIRTRMGSDADEFSPGGEVRLFRRPAR